jgi:hypothetical protein
MKIEERYGPMAGADRRWDVALWQAAGPVAIFDAAWELICDYQVLRGSDVEEPRLQRTVEHFGKTQG